MKVMRPWFGSKDYKEQRTFEQEERIDVRFNRLEEAVIAIQTWINEYEKRLGGDEKK